MKLNDMIAKKLRKDFPLLSQKINGKPIIFVDNASTTQKPEEVIEAVSGFYENTNANVHRGVYLLSEEATKQYEEAHAVVARFINASPEEIIFTKNTTESINLLAYTLGSLFAKDCGAEECGCAGKEYDCGFGDRCDDGSCEDGSGECRDSGCCESESPKENGSQSGKRNEIVLTEMEHHSNLVPWQQLARRSGMILKFIRMNDDLTLDYDDARRKITSRAAIVSAVHISNAFGTVNDVELLCGLARENGAISIIDAAQSVPHIPIDVKRIKCDFLAFSGHKMLGPTGIGVLYGRKELLQKMPPFLFGGDMISAVSYESAEWNALPMKFEAGTPDISGAVGLAAAIKYLQRIGLKNISAWEHELLDYAFKKLKSIPGVMIHSPPLKHCSGIVSFNIKGIHPHDLASLLADKGVCVRGGHHCAMPVMDKLGLSGTCRASFYLYNTLEDIDALIAAIISAKKIFGKEGSKN